MERACLPLTLLLACAVLAQRDGDIRLKDVVEEMHGSLRSSNMTLSYSCKIGRGSLESAIPPVCPANNVTKAMPPRGGYPYEGCPTGWKFFRGSCYLHIFQRNTWANARKLCQTKGGDLARIPDSDHAKDLSVEDFWILANDRNKEGTLEYGPKENPKYNNLLEEDCVSILKRHDQWDDKPCDKKIPAICSKPACKQGWTYFRSSCYHFLSHKDTWSNSRQACRLMGGDLARIRTKEHNNFLKSVVRETAWILLNDRRHEEKFEYGEGEPAIYLNFAHGEPNNGRMSLWTMWAQEDCVLVSSRMDWNDEHCDEKFAALCSSPAACPPGWRSYDGSCYLFTSTPQTWKDSQISCLKQGGDLATVPNKYHHRYLRNTIKADSWILLNDRRLEGHHEYKNKKAPPYLNLVQEDCVRIERSSLVWNLDRCGISLPSICARDGEGYGYYGTHCNGNELRLSECAERTGRCEPNHAVMVSCSTELIRRLLDSSLHGLTYYSGILQVWERGAWRPVCDTNFNVEAARVVCRQLRIPNRFLAITKTDANRAELMHVGCATPVNGESQCIQDGRNKFICPEAIFPCDHTSLCSKNQYGKDCKAVCGHCAHENCFADDGRCPGDRCMPGFEGVRCDQTCKEGFWGSGCSKICGNCKDGVPCSVSDGSCPRGACAAGFTGEQCISECAPGLWGANCALTCGKCLRGPCCAVNGSCPNGLCKAGYTGQGCNKECKPGMWGIGCFNSCGFCLGKTCDPIHGTCQSGFCVPGHTGSKCNDTCSCVYAKRDAFMGCSLIQWTPMFSVLVIFLGLVILIVRFSKGKYDRKQDFAESMRS